MLADLSPILLAAIEFPDLKPHIFVIPEFFGIGPFPIRWYSLAYIVGLLFAWWWVCKLLEDKDAPMAKRHADDFLLWGMLGVILGGRLGYVLFYNFSHYVENPGQILYIWTGGMSFHGGLLGVILAEVLFTRKYKLDLKRVTDVIACGIPVGLFLGRIANFINDELWGRTTDVAWAFVSRGTGGEARHPSQLYEACLEGIALFLIVNYLWRKTDAKRYPGLISGAFLAWYGFSRFMVEFVREPDKTKGFVFLDLFTMGQILSFPMIAFGLYLIVVARRKGPLQPTRAKKFA